MNNADLIESWLKNAPLVFRWRRDADVFVLSEYATGKSVSLDAGRVVNHRLVSHPQGLGTYLNLVRDDGVEVVLCHAGLAFSPSFAATGPLPDAPSVTCLSDYAKLLAQLDSLLQDATRRAETLLVFNVLISILDGAKCAGFDVGEEEAALDERLSKFEAGISES